MHLHQLKYFVSIVDTGNVTKAAERCFISQPSISQQLHKLEEGIGKKLFLRVKGKLVLTDAGQVMYGQAQKILTTVEEALNSSLNRTMAFLFRRRSVSAMIPTPPFGIARSKAQRRIARLY